MIRRLTRLLFNRWTLYSAALLALGLVIWWTGPHIAVFGSAPLASAAARGALITIIAALIIARQVWAWIKVRRAGAVLTAGLLQPAASAQAADPRNEEARALQQRFATALGLLKKGVMARGTRSPFAQLRSLATGSYLYQLPWYMFIGAPGSGKTTALLHSGLRFPLADDLGPEAVRGVGGTRHCDWWFTDQAVLLDTAGRYTTQDSSQEVDAAGWQAFLGLLKKARPRRPINGVLLTLSTADLLRQSSDERKLHVKALRHRLQELHQTLGIRLPIYVLVTKADLLAGFDEFFSDLGKEEREQVWGTTLPAENGRTLARLPGELDALERRLYQRLAVRLQEESDAAKRVLIYAFPQQFAALRQRLRELVDGVFAPSIYETVPWLRGVYFSSSTQDGSPIDRVMGQLAHAFNLQRKLLSAQRGSGRSYFLTRLLGEVIFSEATLAGTNLKWERRRLLAQWACAAGAAAMVTVATAAWAWSYRNNQRYLSAVATKLVDAKQQVAGVVPGAAVAVDELLPALKSVRELAHASATTQGEVPWRLRFGLYQGTALEEASQQAYRTLLEDAFLPALGQRLERQLQQGFSGNPDLLYEGLKAYVMLHGMHFDQQAMQEWFALDWEEMQASLDDAQRKALQVHVAALYRNGWIDPPSQVDEALLSQVRGHISGTSLAQRIYARLRRMDIASDIAPFTMLEKVRHAELVFVRRSRQPLSSGVPGLYTYDGYHRAFSKAAEEATRHFFAEEAWVLAGGAGQTSSMRSADEVTEAVRRFYLDDYRQQWQRFIADIGVVTKGDLIGTIGVVQLLSDPTAGNPLKRLLSAIARETRLAEKAAEEKDLVDLAQDAAGKKLKSWTRRIPGTGGKRQQPVHAASLEQQLVDDHFRLLHEFVLAPVEGQPAPIDGAIGLLNEVYAMLSAIKAAQDARQVPPPSPTPQKIREQVPRYPEPLRAMAELLVSAAERTAGGGIQSNLTQLLRSEVTEYCTRVISGRYPFLRASQQDVTQEDFARLFGPGGTLDSFFQKNLAELVDISSKPWRFRKVEGALLGRGSDLSEFQKARRIQEVFFREGARASLRFEFKPLEMDATIQQITLDIDGQLVRYAHGPQIPATVQFPGPRGSSQVRVAISPPGAAGTSGVVYEGPWALFRLFDSVLIQPSGQPERFQATLDVAGRRAAFDITASSVQNPFRLRELTEFRCPATL